MWPLHKTLSPPLLANKCEIKPQKRKINFRKFDFFSAGLKSAGEEKISVLPLLTLSEVLTALISSPRFGNSPELLKNERTDLHGFKYNEKNQGKTKSSYKVKGCIAIRPAVIKATLISTEL